MVNGIMTNIVMITQEMKYTDIHHFQIKEFEKGGVVNVVPIESKFNPADLITKPIKSIGKVFRDSVKRIGTMITRRKNVDRGEEEDKH